MGHTISRIENDTSSASRRVPTGKNKKHKDREEEKESVVEGKDRQYNKVSYRWVYVQTQDCLYRGEEGGHIKRLEKNLRGHFAVLHWVQRSLSQQDRVLIEKNGIPIGR